MMAHRVRRLPPGLPSATIVWTGLFWLSTYAVFSVRGRLLARSPLDWIDERRLLAVSVGALLYGIAITLQSRIVQRPFGVRAGAAIGLAGLSSAAVLAVRLLFNDEGLSDPDSRSAEFRWLITWLGYSLAWIAFYVAATSSYAAGSSTLPLHPDRDENSESDDIWVQRGQQRVRIPVTAIDYVEAEGNYACIHAGDSQGLVRIPLAQLETRLGAEFARIHRSVICRRSSIQAVERAPTGAFRAVLASGAVVPVGRRMGAELLDEMRSGRTGASA